MKRTHIVHVALACGLLATSAPLFAQEFPASTFTPLTARGATTPNWFSGAASLLLLGRDNIESSKFQEYREIAKGASMPVFAFQGSHDGNDFALYGQNVARTDQRYFGRGNFGVVGVHFDYNQIPHNMGNNGQVLHNETASGVWTMNATLRQTLGAAVDAVPTTARTYPFYANLLTPTIAAAGHANISQQRNRGDVGVDLPYGLAVTYLRETKTGYRGASGGDILGTVTSAVDVPETINEVTQDFGVRWAQKFKAANAYASFNRNLYNDRLDALIIDNPFRATDLAYVSTSVPGGPASARFNTYPDNEATRFAFGGQYKLAHQTRIAADLAFNRWTQDAAFLPFTINTSIFRPDGVSAATVASLPATSLNGKINTTSVNLSFVSRPVDPLSVRVRYRRYDLQNKSPRISWLDGSTADAPDRSWFGVNPSEEAAEGFPTANRYSNTSDRFDAQVGYDIGTDFTVEGTYRHVALKRTFREATSGDENGYSLAGIYRRGEWMTTRAMFERIDRSAKGFDPATSIGLQSDEAERNRTRAGVDFELTPIEKIGFVFSYFHWNDDYPNRPNRIASIPDTTVGLLDAKYDTFTFEIDYSPNERTQVSGYYTYEKNAQTNRWLSGITNLATYNQLQFDASDKGDTFGANATVQLVPDKWALTAWVRHQKIDGLNDITAREAGSFYTPGRCQSACANTPVPPLVAPGTGGAADMTNFDDTGLTTFVADLAYTLAEAWTFSVGYAYDKYTISDAFSNGTTMFPQSVLFYMKANDKDYEANLGYARLTYRF